MGKPLFMETRPEGDIIYGYGRIGLLATTFVSSYVHAPMRAEILIQRKDIALYGRTNIHSKLQKALHFMLADRKPVIARLNTL